MNKAIKVIIAYNFILILFFSIYIFDFWGVTFPPYFNLFFFLELGSTIASVIFYILLRSSINKNWLTDKLFFTLLFLFIYGAGMHMSANQINVFAESPTILFYDEYLSHWVAHLAILGLAGLIAIRQLKYPSKESVSKGIWLLLLLSALVQGYTSAIFSLEGRSVLLSLPVSLLLVVTLKLKLNKNNWRLFPISVFYLVFFSVALLTIFAWFLKNSGFLEPSSSGFGVFK